MKIRLPPDVKIWLAVRAEANDRSINKEILSILKNARGGEDQNKKASKSSKQQH